MTNHEETIAALNELIEYCKDGEYGYKAAAEDIKNPLWKPYFISYSGQRAQFASDLEYQVVELGQSPEYHTSLTGDLHRTWIDIKAAIESGDEKGILAECERGDEAAVKKYEEVLESTELPDSLRNIIAQQHEKIKSAYEHIKASAA